MREIKFKAKTIGNEWVFGNVSHLKKDFSTARKGHYISNSAGAPFAFMVRPETICQYIGWKDKNSKEIYIGDTCKDEENDLFVVIQIDCGRYALKMIENSYVDEFIDWSEVEIIGSIHTTPELLNPSNN